MGMLKRLGKLLGMDSAIYYTLLARLWGMSSGIVSIGLISRFLSPAEQGYYYTFAGILAFQIFFELGVGHVIMQFASHEAAHLNWTGDWVLTGDVLALSRLRSFFLLQVKWYAAIALLIVAIVLPAGWLFLERNAAQEAVSWHLPWIAITLTAALNLLVTPLFSLYEASGKVAEIARVRWIQAVTGSLSGWSALVAGHGLFVAAAANVSAIVIAVIWMRARSGPFLKNLLAADHEAARVSWRQEIWPLQWKISASWMSGFLIFQLFVPLLFNFRGAVEAGRMGMSLSIANAAMAIPMAWMNTKTPAFGAFIATKKFEELDNTFFAALWRSMAIMTALSATVVVAAMLAADFHVHAAQRVVAPLALALLMGATTVNYLVFAQSVYLRAHKEEPFLWPSLAAGMLIGISISLAAKPYGATGMMACYFLASLLVALWCTWIFFQKRRKWHE